MPTPLKKKDGGATENSTFSKVERKAIKVGFSGPWSPIGAREFRKEKEQAGEGTGSTPLPFLKGP